jgi:hypothetical protein
LAIEMAAWRSNLGDLARLAPLAISALAIRALAIPPHDG